VPQNVGFITLLLNRSANELVLSTFGTPEIPFASLRRGQPESRRSCVAPDMITYLEAVEMNPQEGKAYIRLILEQEWIWGLSTCQDSTASSHWAALGIRLEPPMVPN
jgi:hypothetical protein